MWDGQEIDQLDGTSKYVETAQIGDVALTWIGNGVFATHENGTEIMWFCSLEDRDEGARSVYQLFFIGGVKDSC